MIELNANFVRLHINWGEVEPEPGVYNFNRSDLAARFYAETGIEPIIIFKCTPILPDTSIDADTTGWDCCERDFWEVLHDTTGAAKELSWFPADTAKWCNFLRAFVERYDGDGEDDLVDLARPFGKYKFEVEYPRVWCNCTDDPLQSWIDYNNMSYRAVKSADSTAIAAQAGYAGADIHLFYAGYSPSDSFLLRMDSDREIYVTHEDLEDHPFYYSDSYTRFYRNFTEIDYDFYDIHLYGFAELMEYRAEGMRDLFGEKPIVAGEGGGPFMMRGERFNPENDSGYISPELARENASYVVRYFVGGISAGFSWLAWHVNPEYDMWGQTFGDLNLKSIDYENKPSYWTYAGLASILQEYDSAYSISEPEEEIQIKRIETPQNLTVFWNLSDDSLFSEIFISSGARVLVFPDVMGDSLWDTLYFARDSLVTFYIDRNPIIIEGDIDFMAINIDEQKIPAEPGFNVLNNKLGIIDIEIFTGGRFEIFDILGKNVYSKNLPSTGTHHIEKHFTTGVYLAKLTTERDLYFKKIVVFY